MILLRIRAPHPQEQNHPEEKIDGDTNPHSFEVFSHTDVGFLFTPKHLHAAQSAMASIESVAMSFDENLLLVRLRSKTHESTLFVIEKDIQTIKENGRFLYRANRHEIASPSSSSKPKKNAAAFLPFDLRKEDRTSSAATDDFIPSHDLLSMIDNSSVNRVLLLAPSDSSHDDIAVEDLSKDGKESIIKTFPFDRCEEDPDKNLAVHQIVVSPCGRFVSLLFDAKRGCSQIHTNGQEMIGRYRLNTRSFEVYEREFMNYKNTKKVPVMFASKATGTKSLPAATSETVFSLSADESKILVGEQDKTNPAVRGTLKDSYSFGAAISSAFCNLH